MNYNYEIAEDVALSEYEFSDPEEVDEIQDLRPIPDPFRCSTKTINVQLFPIVNTKKRIDYIKSEILIKYPELAEVITNEHLEEILITRIIRDGISFDYFFEILAQRFKKNKDLDFLISHIIKMKNSRLLDIIKIAEETEITEERFHFVWMYKEKPRFDQKILRKLKLKLPNSVMQGKDGFRNQVTLRFFAPDKKRLLNMMIFKNGKLTISGVRNSQDLIYAIELIIEHIKNLQAMAYKDLFVHNISYQSINTHFDLNFKLDNKKLLTAMQREVDQCPEMLKIDMNNLKSFSDLKIRFFIAPLIDKELEQCKSIINRTKNIIKLPVKRTKEGKGSSVTFFQTGKVNIYGSSSTEEVEKVYNLINQIMSRIYQDII